MLHLHPSQILEFNEGWISRENLHKNIAFSFVFQTKCAISLGPSKSDVQVIRYIGKTVNIHLEKLLWFASVRYVDLITLY